MFRRGLGETGYVEGRNAKIERWRRIRLAKKKCGGSLADI
jgi:hypothetical protein